ncbi:MAG: EAL domain-containing protein [Oceanococcus sp.]
MRSLTIGLVALFLLVTGMTTALAQPPTRAMAFKALSQNEGLSQNTVNDIYQDSRGFLWLASESGLNRYDGVSFQIFQRDPSNPTSLPGNFVWAIAEDNSGDLWLATRGAGLVRWQRSSENFSQPLDIESEQFATTRSARSVLIDQQQHIWLGTQKAGLLQLNPKGQLLHWYATDGKKTGSINALMQDNNGQILVASDQGLWRVDEANKSLQAIALNWPDSEKQESLSSLFRSRDGALWIGSFEAGLLRMHEQLPPRHFKPQQDSPHSLSHLDVREMLQDQQERIWVATQGGLNLYREDTQDFVHYQHVDNDPYSLSDSRLMSLAQDKTGLLWVGTRVGGVNRWNPRSWALGAQSPAELADSGVLAFADHPSGDIWVGGFGAPLARFNAEGQMSARFSPEFGYPTLAESPVTALLRDSAGRLWIGTFDAGLYIYDPVDNSLKQLQHQENQAASLGANGVMSLLQSADQTVWVGTFGGGVARVDNTSLKVTRIAGDELAGIRATALMQDPFQQIWIASDGAGLFRYAPSTQTLSHFPRTTDTQTGPSADTLYTLHMGAAGQLWLGTADAGLQFIAPKHLQAANIVVQNAGFAHALPDQSINGLRSDLQGHLWISTNRGLVRVHADNGTMREFHRAQGLQSEELNFGAHFRDSNGLLYFGGAGGYNQFNPADLNSALAAPEIVITQFEKFNRPVRFKQAISDIKSLVLAHNDDVISFSYALMDFTEPRENRYSIKLEGFDKNWSPEQAHARSTYTNLDPGDYVLKVRGLNSDGLWTEKSRDIAIQVKTAPWATPQARAAYVLGTLLLLFALYRWRIQVAQREARIEQLAYYDDVTGLPNRDLFEQRGQHHVAKAAHDKSQLCLIVLQVGPLKHLHDSLGYRSSHDVYRSLSARLTLAVFGDGASNASRELARLSDESFVVLLHLNEPSSEGMRWAQQLLDLVQQPLEFGEHKVKVPAKAGIACYPDHGLQAEGLIEHANTAAHDTQSSTAPSASFYAPAMTERAKQRLALESDLRNALRNDGLQLFLQGKFTPQGQLVGAEALTRWTHPQHGPISPAVFVPLAEESELIMELDDWVIDQAYFNLAKWQDQGLDGLNIAVNVSAETFVSGRIFSALERNRERYQLDPVRLEIEVTESVLASDIELITETLNRIKSMGHVLSLDDFGTGYSSLTYLQKFPIDKLKIDQAFVKDLEHQPEQLALCKAIVALARSLHLQTIAEGVENQAQLDILEALGCDHLQGFFLHRPQAIADFQTQRLGATSVPRNNS